MKIEVDAKQLFVFVILILFAAMFHLQRMDSYRITRTLETVNETRDFINTIDEVEAE